MCVCVCVCVCVLCVCVCCVCVCVCVCACVHMHISFSSVNVVWVDISFDCLCIVTNKWLLYEVVCFVCTGLGSAHTSILFCCLCLHCAVLMKIGFVLMFAVGGC